MASVKLKASYFVINKKTFLIRMLKDINGMTDYCEIYLTDFINSLKLGPIFV